MEENSVENLAVSLVREYLSRKGFKHTLNLFDKESMKKINSIQNRRVLAEKLGIIVLVKKNKENGSTFRCFLEMVVHYLKEKKIDSPKHKRDAVIKATTRIPNDSTDIINSSIENIFASPKNETNKNTERYKFDLPYEVSPILSPHESNNTSPVMSPREESTSKIPRFKYSPSGRSASLTDLSHVANGYSSKDINGNDIFDLNHASVVQVSKDSASSIQSSRKKRENYVIQSTHSSRKKPPSKRINPEKTIPQKSDDIKDRSESFIENLRKEKQSSQNNISVSSLSSPVQTIIRKQSSQNRTIPLYQKKSDNQVMVEKCNKPFNNNAILLDDVESDFDLVENNISDATYEISNQRTTNNATTLHIKSGPLTLETAIELKMLLFGSPSMFFNQEWKLQGFCFSKHYLLKYGLVQVKGGPCGLLASVQAIVIKNLFFNSREYTKVVSIPQPSEKQQIDALIKSLVDILWLVKNGDNVTVPLATASVKFSSNGIYKSDKLTEKLQLFCFNDKEKLRLFLLKNVSYFAKEYGCILFLYAAILTCGIQNIRNSMDETKTTLIGRHGYCTQEMVNLLLTGKAFSNVFDGVVHLDKTLLRGLESQNDIGFLSLFEHYDSCKVGDNYKSPHYPIWVVCSESHFSVLFSMVDTVKVSQFDMYYYDGLACQDEEIRLTINLKSGRRTPSIGRLDLIPPLEHCIRTKWKNAHISWNDTDPIL